MQNSLESNVVDAVQFVWHGEEDNLIEVTLPNPQESLQRILRNVVRMTRWEDIRRIAKHIASREGYASDSMTFRYPNPHAPEGTPYTNFEGVYLFDAGQKPLHVQEPAFDRLITRLLTTTIEGAIQSESNVIYEEWWQQFLADAEIIIARSEAI